MSPVPPRLELVRLAKHYGEVAAVRELSLAVARGEFVSLLGPSGCGKSTTLAMIAGFDTPSAGDILVDGRSCLALPPRRRRIGLVFQDYAVFSRMSVRENLSFGLEAHRVPRAERLRRIAELAGRLRLDGILDRPGNRLNMSEMQRVALGRALAVGPDILLLDEPMSNLDTDLRHALRAELKAIQRELGQTIIYVTHDQAEALAMSDRIVVMRAGRIEQVGTPTEVYDRPTDRFVAQFIGEPPVNLIAAELLRDRRRVRLALPGEPVMPVDASPLPAGPCWAAVRPEDVEVRAERQGAGLAGLTVRDLEYLGPTEVLHLEHPAGTLRAIAAPGSWVVGMRVTAALATSAVHLLPAEAAP